MKNIKLLLIIAGAMILSSLLTTRLIITRLIARHIEPGPGFRSVALPVNSEEVSALEPGDRVDVITVFPATNGKSGPESAAHTIIQNVRVLRTRLAGGTSGKGTVYVELDPNQTQYAVLAGDEKKVHVVLRSKADADVHPMEVVRMTKLFK